MEFVYENEKAFELDESFTMMTSGIVGTIGSIVIGDPNIGDSYTLDKGHREDHVDFGRIIRKDEATKNIAIPHPIVPIRTVAIGAPANIPAEAAAVPRPIIKLLCFASTTLPSATITTGKEHAPVPIPTIKPVKINRVSSKKMPRKA